MKEPGYVQQALLVEDCISHYLRLLLSTGWAKIRFSCDVSTKLVRYVMCPFTSIMYCSWIQIIDVPPVCASKSVCEWTLIWLDPSGGWPHWPHAGLMASEAHVSACEKTTVKWNLPLWADSGSHVLKAYCENLSSELFVFFAHVLKSNNVFTLQNQKLSKNAFTFCFMLLIGNVFLFFCTM